jgi:hypothetical protein
VVKRVKKKTPKQLDREIASSLVASGQPELAAMFASPEARRVFASEMRHELQLREASRRNAAAMAERPFTVKRLLVEGGKRFRELVGNFKTEAEARAKADQLGGWVELRDGTVVYGRAEIP